ncbi:hypothetical protein [Microbispora sp. KK1-11]|uniref:hypothetical protein n=1 Tax=Microbispora sp. KK1-11 TaxID=2053005 RepID=UPI00115896A6|nr:hypothetical protein [Microbispora sp. KK1-11]TQS29106.1 hypothetical protein FLW16_12230 [Microbispora sp. KK1-11]
MNLNIRCEVCTNVSMTVPDADWNEAQRHLVGEWWDRHLKDAHDGEEGVVYTFDENIFYERPRRF